MCFVHFIFPFFFISCHISFPLCLSPSYHTLVFLSIFIFIIYYTLCYNFIFLNLSTPTAHTLLSPCRGGVLEPAGTTEIKFKMKDLVKAMRRLDDKYSSLYKKLASPGKENILQFFCFILFSSLISPFKFPFVLRNLPFLEGN